MSAPARGGIPSLDGIRAVAVSLVFAAHSGLEKLVPGGLGVTIFFVLSGYLITTLLRIEHAERGGISLRAFYLRRALRLLPPLAIVVALAAALSAAGWIDGRFSPLGLASTLFYFGNYYVIAHDFNGLPAGIGIVWSLAVEEHYYLFYPPLAALLLRLGRPGLAAAVLAALCALVLGWRCWLAARGVSADYVYMATDTRIDAVLAGCLLAVLRNPWLAPAPPRPAREAALALACLAVLLGTVVWRDAYFRMTLRYTLQAFAIAPLLWLAVARSASRPYRWLNARPLVWLGGVSYTVYLVHHLVLRGLAWHWPQLGGAPAALLALALTLAVAEAMRRVVDQPFAALRRRLHRERSPAAAHEAAQAAPAARTPAVRYSESLP